MMCNSVVNIGIVWLTWANYSIEFQSVFTNLMTLVFASQLVDLKSNVIKNSWVSAVGVSGMHLVPL